MQSGFGVSIANDGCDNTFHVRVVVYRYSRSEEREAQWTGLSFDAYIFAPQKMSARKFHAFIETGQAYFAAFPDLVLPTTESGGNICNIQFWGGTEHNRNECTAPCPLKRRSEHLSLIFVLYSAKKRNPNDEISDDNNIR